MVWYYMNENEFLGWVGACPKVPTWEARRVQFRTFEFAALGNKAWSNHPQIEPLIYELEHCYCAGAWIAALVLAHSLVELHMHSKGLGNKKKWGEYLGPLGLDTRVRWLCDRRNALLHMKDPSVPSVRITEIVDDREGIYRDAKVAVIIALKVAFLDSHNLSESRHCSVNEGG